MAKANGHLIDYNQVLMGTNKEPLVQAAGEGAFKDVTFKQMVEIAIWQALPEEANKPPDWKAIAKRGRIADAMEAGEPLSLEQKNIIMERLKILPPKAAYAVAKILDPEGVAKL